jgi:hypothetical protein
MIAAVRQTGSCSVSRQRFASLFAAAALGAALLTTSGAAEVFGGAARDVPLARFQDPLCPGVVGIQLERAQEIVGIIRDNATRLGLRTADPQTCEPNLIVDVMDDPRAYLQGLMKRRPYLWQEMDSRQRQKLLEDSGPVRSWVRVQVRTRDGMMVPLRENLVELPQTTMAMAHSKIYRATRRDIISAMVLIEPSAAQGLTVAQLADYATMRALSDDAGDQIAEPHPSILTLFGHSGDRPAGLTDADWVLLRTIYSTEPNDPAAITLAMANDRIAKSKTAP